MNSLEALNLIITRLHPSPDNVAKAMHEVKIVEKELKALEIIKKKRVNVHSWYYNDCNKIPYEIYKQSIMARTISSELLTQEEYDLLKEIVK